MSFPTLTNPEWLENATREELEALISQIQGYLNIEHKSDGSHEHVTADSVTVNETATGAGGTVSAEKNITADSDGTLPVSIGSHTEGAGINFGDQWQVIAATASSPGSGSDHELQFWHREIQSANPVFSLVYVSAQAAWTVLSRGVGGMRFGTSSRRIDQIDVLTLNAVTAFATNGTVAHTAEIAPTQITANQNDYAPTGHAATYAFFLSSDAARNITGLAGGAEGRTILFMNDGNFDISLTHQDAASTAANRFRTPGEVTFTLNRADSVLLRYRSSRWCVLGF